MKICLGFLLCYFVYVVYSNYFQYNAKEFFLSKMFFESYSDAKHHCHKERGQLARIKSNNVTKTFGKLLLKEMRICQSEYRYTMKLSLLSVA